MGGAALRRYALPQVPSLRGSMLPGATMGAVVDPKP